jgi:1-acyl-sn-glycerol-3-phosphate acyltransferase
MNETKRKLFDLLKGWEETLPADVAPIVRRKALELDDAVIEDFFQKFEVAGLDWGFSEFAPLVKIILDDTLKHLLNTDIKGDKNLKDALKALKNGEYKRLVILSNHLSYSDANVIAAMFADYFKEADLDNMLSVVAGPKVFTHPLRKFSSMHFNPILIAQSQSVATGEATLPLRVIARAAVKVVKDIKEHVKIFLVFPEGKRSRDGALTRFLPGVYRLIDTGDVRVLPVSVLGGDKFLPISCAKLSYTDIKINIGMMEDIKSIREKYENAPNFRQDAMDYLGGKVAALHPEDKRGYYSK